MNAKDSKILCLLCFHGKRAKIWKRIIIYEETRSLVEERKELEAHQSQQNARWRSVRAQALVPAVVSSRRSNQSTFIKGLTPESQQGEHHSRNRAQEPSFNPSRRHFLSHLHSRRHHHHCSNPSPS
jgi:hypothetical protein